MKLQLKILTLNSRSADAKRINSFLLDFFTFIFQFLASPENHVEEKVSTYLSRVASTYLAAIYLAASPYSRSSSSLTTTAKARPPRIVSFSIYVAINVLDLFMQF